MKSMDSLHGLTVLLTGLEVVRHVNPANDEDTVVLADLAPYVRTQVPFTRVNSARLQRASEGPG